MRTLLILVCLSLSLPAHAEEERSNAQRMAYMRARLNVACTEAYALLFAGGLRKTIVVAGLVLAAPPAWRALVGTFAKANFDDMLRKPLAGLNDEQRAKLAKDFAAVEMQWMEQAGAFRRGTYRQYLLGNRSLGTAWDRELAFELGTIHEARLHEIPDYHQRTVSFSGKDPENTQFRLPISQIHLYQPLREKMFRALIEQHKDQDTLTLGQVVRGHVFSGDPARVEFGDGSDSTAASRRALDDLLLQDRSDDEKADALRMANAEADYLEAYLKQAAVLSNVELLYPTLQRKFERHAAYEDVPFPRFPWRGDWKPAFVADRTKYWEQVAVRVRRVVPDETSPKKLSMWGLMGEVFEGDSWIGADPDAVPREGRE